MDHPEGRTRRGDAVGLLFLRQRPPEVSRRLEQVADLIDLNFRAVALLAGVEREAEHADGVGLTRPEERRGHRQVLMDARELHRLAEGVAADRLARLEGRLARGD